MQNRGAMKFSRPLIRIVDVRGGTNADEHLLTVSRKHHIARPVAAPFGKSFTDHFWARRSAFRSPLLYANRTIAFVLPTYSHCGLAPGG